MSWLAPLGFLGLISVIVLIIIYIIKPNYQQKMISSTYIWKLSLKYKKRSIPINKLNNVLVFLCQLLILTICALLLAQPVIAEEKTGDEGERIIIIDASASMLVSNAQSTRFERAVGEARFLAEDTLENGGSVSLILASDTPEFMVQRLGADRSDDVYAAFDSLLADGGACTYGSADVEGAVALAEEVLRYNYEAQIYFYTATEYIEDNGIFVENVADETEWNAAVLGCEAEYNNSNHYEISINLGCYGRTEQLTVYCKVHGANGNGASATAFASTFEKTEFFDPSDEEKTITFTTDDFGGAPLYSFDYIEVYVSVSDSFRDDNSFFLYGGQKQTIRVQYASSVPNNYFGGVIRTIRQSMRDDWTIEFKELKADEKAETEGFDFYIFEHRMPDVIPTDGLVLLVDPQKAPEGSGIMLGGSYQVNSNSTLASGTPHELTNYVNSSRITIAKYTDIVSSDGYEELAYYNGRPMILAKNEDTAKVVVWAFDLNYSNLIAMPDFSFLMYNMFNYYIPTTLDSNAFEIGDTVELTARGTELKVSSNGEETVFENKTGEMVASQPGTYTVTQKLMDGESIVIENFFVSIPNEESNITKQIDQLPIASVEAVTEIEYLDLLFYFAIALVSLMFIEWILQSKKNY